MPELRHRLAHRFNIALALQMKHSTSPLKPTSVHHVTPSRARALAHQPQISQPGTHSFEHLRRPTVSLNPLSSPAKSPNLYLARLSTIAPLSRALLLGQSRTFASWRRRLDGDCCTRVSTLESRRGRRVLVTTIILHWSVDGFTEKRRVTGSGWRSRRSWTRTRR